MRRNWGEPPVRRQPCNENVHGGWTSTRRSQFRHSLMPVCGFNKMVNLLESARTPADALRKEETMPGLKLVARYAVRKIYAFGLRAQAIPNAHVLLVGQISPHFSTPDLTRSASARAAAAAQCFDPSPLDLMRARQPVWVGASPPPTRAFCKWTWPVFHSSCVTDINVRSQPLEPQAVVRPSLYASQYKTCRPGKKPYMVITTGLADSWVSLHRGY
ncbi:hypothetical protein NA57DRAFT_54476 [Rhizodiscina lignyota]|uniref:Uncharacterized protein n=1 Tax=Rhizodiscina lignyota TaxID=1504668 RepID=A0A9P4IF22_9PEZI|nr:hypothetical protein NA57DRAFT_54476 [Rhizodiscina lignyota]